MLPAGVVNTAPGFALIQFDVLAQNLCQSVSELVTEPSREWGIEHANGPRYVLNLETDGEAPANPMP